MNFEELVLWGIPLLGLANSIKRFIKWVVPTVSEKALLIIGGVLLAIAVFFTQSIADFVVEYPVIEVWGPRVLWALVAFLFYTGNYASALRARFAK